MEVETLTPHISPVRGPGAPQIFLLVGPDGAYLHSKHGVPLVRGRGRGIFQQNVRGNAVDIAQQNMKRPAIFFFTQTNSKLNIPTLRWGDNKHWSVHVAQMGNQLESADAKTKTEDVKLKREDGDDNEGRLDHLLQELLASPQVTYARNVICLYSVAIVMCFD